MLKDACSGPCESKPQPLGYEFDTLPTGPLHQLLDHCTHCRCRWTLDISTSVEHHYKLSVYAYNQRHVPSCTVTGSSAIAERPRNALCLSEVGYIFNFIRQVTVQYLERSILLLVTSGLDLSMPTVKSCSVLFGVVVHAGCDKQVSLICGGLRGKRTSTLSAIN